MKPPTGTAAEKAPCVNVTDCPDVVELVNVTLPRPCNITKILFVPTQGTHESDVDITVDTVGNPGDAIAVQVDPSVGVAL
jgi:hypothetical protein